jgi:putative radical SAM enzyme (TIGR03279 family)
LRRRSDYRLVAAAYVTIIRNGCHMESGITIEKVEPGSIAAELELASGDRLLAINGHPVQDIIDFGYYSGEEELLLEVEKADGDIWEIELLQEEGESLGILFESPKPRSCSNSCLFCFVDQLPEGLRRSLYVKDEDYRLSFLYGNFVTLTSLRQEEVRRICEQRLSPLYISVHATEPDVRSMLLGNSECPPVLDLLTELASSGIRMHTQVVLCPGLNDGLHLERTVRDLAALFPQVASLAVVPLGLTRFRDSLPELRQVTSHYASEFLALWQPRARELAEQLGTPFLYFADEFYLKAEKPFPPLADYGDLPQIENGVGMIPLFLEEAEDVLDNAEPMREGVVAVVTGKTPYPYLDSFLRRLAEKTGVTFRVFPVNNSLFGDSVTVAGLVPGRDILEMYGREGFADVELVVIPDVMLKEGEDVFIDDVTIGDLRETLGMQVEVCVATPSGLYETIKRCLAI